MAALGAALWIVVIVLVRYRVDCRRFVITLVVVLQQKQGRVRHGLVIE